MTDKSETEISTCWPSTLRKNSIDGYQCPKSTYDAALKKPPVCQEAKCTGPPSYDPKIIEQNELDFESGEWTEFGSDDALENLISLCGPMTGV
eukprot:8253988-Ditylum_brightwellii.AAC.1